VQIRLPPKAQIHPKTLRQKDRGTRRKPKNSGERWRLQLPSTDGANLSGIEDRGVKRKIILSFHPFFVSRTGINKCL
jgi:hypothetical protein